MTDHQLRCILNDQDVINSMLDNGISLHCADQRFGASIERRGSAVRDHLIGALRSRNLDDVTTRGPSSPLLHAIIKRNARPALLIRKGCIDRPTLGFWLNQLGGWLGKAAPSTFSVGRLDASAPTPVRQLGTAWVIAPGLLVTNRHVAVRVATGEGANCHLRRSSTGTPLGMTIDLRGEAGCTATAIARCAEVVYMEPSGPGRPDLAFLRIHAPDFPEPEPLHLGARAAPDVGSLVAAVGFPAQDWRHDLIVVARVFGAEFGVKRFSPGRVVEVTPSRLAHDCSTLCGSSGSALLDIRSGEVVGLHFGGNYLEKNVAVPAHVVADRLVRIKRAAGSRHVSMTVGMEASTEDSPVAPREHPLGYAPDFLGTDAVVALPGLPAGMVAAPVRESEDAILRYTHFSICIREDRAQPFFTAVNIDGALLYRFPRRNTAWRRDDRLVNADSAQWGPELYWDNTLDRGHLVRRLDAAWGQDREEARRGDDDTFYYTNCCPQHATLNQGEWLRLEDFILERSEVNEARLSIFTGPVMADSDRTYRGAQLPEEYWKVAAMIHAETGDLTSAAFLLSQCCLLDELEGALTGFATYQVPVALIAERTGLDFGPLTAADATRGRESPGAKLIQGPEDLDLGRSL